MAVHTSASIALKPPVWVYCIEGPSEFSSQFAEVRLAANGGQPLFTLGLPMFDLTRVHFLSLLWSPSTNTKILYFLSKCHWKDTHKFFKKIM